jgi:hypothetical protein
MGFTVQHAGDTRDVEFEPYAQLLHQKGVDLARLPRVAEPGTCRRWLHVWNARGDAQAFADELKNRTSEAWEVVEVHSTPSEGPLGPLEIQFGQRNDGYGFGLHPFSQLMMERIFAVSCRRIGVSIYTEYRPSFHTARREVPDLAGPVAVLLTGLSLDKLKETFGGYRVYDPKTKKEVASSGPVQGRGSPVSSGEGGSGSGS